jgi:hypothetical protein
MSSQKDETPKLAAGGFREHYANVAAFEDNHGADRATFFYFAQATAAAVVQGMQQ